MSLADPLDVWEHAARAFEMRAPDPVREAADADAWATPGTLAQRLSAKVKQTKALDMIDAALMRLVDTPDGRLIITMPPQQGKSERAVKDFVLWSLKHRPWLRVVCASYGQGLANRNGRAIRNMIRSHPELGLAVAKDNGSASEWQLANHTGGLISVGIGGGLTGRACDLMVIDDPIKDRKEADSSTFRENVWSWWTDVASTRLGPGAPVVLILTRWHELDLAGQLLAGPDGHRWEVLRIPAQADHDPEKGETDPLDREPGEYMDSVQHRTDEQWEAVKVEKGSRSWQALYQGRPTSAEGSILKREWWQRYEQPQWWVADDGVRTVMSQFDSLIQSWDLAFKDTDKSDFVVGQVWGRRGGNFFLLDQVRGRWDFVETCRQVESLTARWPQALLKLVEDKANGPAVLAALRQQGMTGLLGEEPQGSKVARASAVSPLIEAGNVWIPAATVEGCAWVGDLVEEAAAFPTGANDDQVDAMTQALNRLALQPLVNEVVQPEEYDLVDARGWWASPV